MLLLNPPRTDATPLFEINKGAEKIAWKNVHYEKILIINGHPNADAFCFGLSGAYKKGALSKGAEIKEIIIRELDFNPNLAFGYQKRTELEPDLLAAWEKIKWADHLVWVHPVWWGGLPALTKGFIDRVFLPGFAFRYRGKFGVVG